MREQADIAFQDNQYFVIGALTMANVMRVRNKGLQLFAGSRDLVVDFSRLSSCDSSGLALLLDWVKFAKESGKKISFKYLSPEVISIAKAAGLDVILSQFVV